MFNPRNVERFTVVRVASCDRSDWDLAVAGWKPTNRMAWSTQNLEVMIIKANKNLLIYIRLDWNGWS